MKIRRVDFYPDDWITGTVELSLAECGLYITACMLIYSHGGPISRDHLKATARCHGNEFNRIVKRLIGLGKLIGNGSEISNKRCENELERARKRVGKAQENASKRWKSNGIADAGALPIAYANKQQPSYNNQQAEESPHTVPPNGADPGKRRGTRLPADWQPGEALRALAFRLGLDIERTTVEFVDYWIAVPGSKGNKLDWDATFRNRCREVASRARPSARASAVDNLIEGFGRAAGLRRSGNC